MLIRTPALCLMLLVLCAGSTLDDVYAQTGTGSAPAASTFVIVHGAWGGGWAFRRVETLLRARGHTVYRPSLTGLGERVHLATPDVSLSTHIDDIVNVLVFEDLHEVTLVGHSYGGMVITGVADRVPERIRSLIYIDALVPNDGDSAAGLLGPRTDWLKQMTKGGFIVPPWVKPEQPLPKDVPQPLKTFTEAIVLRNKAGRAVPATYILTMEAGKNVDDFSSQAERARARGWPVHILQADHNPQWSAPEPLVQMLDRYR
jgi:pimeloyl-ACP methyl ester carboxylesterase